MSDPKVFSTEAIAYATLQLVHGILRQLVEREVITDEQVSELFDQAAANQRVSPMPANQEAADLLADMVSKQRRKFR
jgi:hypothetical protein